MISEFEMSVRKACAALGVSRSDYAYVKSPNLGPVNSRDFPPIFGESPEGRGYPLPSGLQIPLASCRLAIHEAALRCIP